MLQSEKSNQSLPNEARVRRGRALPSLIFNGSNGNKFGTSIDCKDGWTKMPLRVPLEMEQEVKCSA